MSEFWRQFVKLSAVDQESGSGHEYRVETLSAKVATLRLGRESPDRLRCSSRNTIDNDGIFSEVRKALVEGKRGGLRAVTAEDIDGVAQSRGSGRVALGAVSDMLDKFGKAALALPSVQLPDLTVRQLPMQADCLTVPSAGLVPVLGQLVHTLGQALTKNPNSPTVQAHFCLDIGPNGELREGSHQKILFGVENPGSGTEGILRLNYRPIGWTARGQYADLSFSFTDTATTETLHPAGNGFRVVQEDRTTITKEGPDLANHITTMANRIVQLLG